MPQPKKAKRATATKKAKRATKKAAAAKTPPAAAAEKLTVGAMAPAFDLVDANGERVTNETLGGTWAVLYFYPKDNTPGCTTEAREFSEKIGAFAAQNAVVYGISPDDAACHRKFIDTHALTVKLLADPEKTAIAAFGAWGAKKLYGKEFEGVLRSTILLKPNGEVAEIWRNVRAAGHAEKVFDRLMALQRADDRTHDRAAE